MDELDALLSESFKRVSEPGDPTGVVDDIRTRIDVGDTGSPSNTSGFGSGGGWAWIPWAGAGVVVAVAGAAVGASGVFGPAQPAHSAAAVPMPIITVTDGLDCPGGSPVVGFRPGERVLAIARSKGSEYLGVRSPFDRAETVWLPTSAVAIDADEPEISSLDVGGCIEATVTRNAPTPATPAKPTPPTGHTPSKPPPPAPDTQKPTLGTPSGTQTVGCVDGFDGHPGTTTISIPASDNKGVTGVSISWSEAGGGSAHMVKSGSTWRYTYNPPDNYAGTVNFTMVAHDAAGNHSSPKSFAVTVHCLV